MKPKSAIQKGKLLEDRGKSKYRRWTFQEDELLKSLYQKKRLFELANIFNRHWNKVCRRAILLGIKKDKEFFSKEISESHKKMFREGKRSNRGESNPNWNGGSKRRFGGISCGKYNTIHDWIKKNYGKANKCENKDCKKISRTYDWAKREECGYEKNVKNFYMLCRSCHMKLDLNV